MGLGKGGVIHETYLYTPLRTEGVTRGKYRIRLSRRMEGTSEGSTYLQPFSGRPEKVILVIGTKINSFCKVRTTNLRLGTRDDSDDRTVDGILLSDRSLPDLTR